MATIEGVVQNIAAGSKTYREQVLPRADASKRVFEGLSGIGLEESHPTVSGAIASMFRNMRERLEGTSVAQVVEHTDTAHSYYTAAFGVEDMAPEQIKSALGGALSMSAYATHHAGRLQEVTRSTLEVIDDAEAAVLKAVRRELDEIAISADNGVGVAEQLCNSADRATELAANYIDSIT